MEDYIVSARKYRPLSFDTVVGQRALTTTLKNAIASGKLAHAYLFCGPRGVGKTTCARIFAKAINCQSPHEGGDACGQCESCRAFDEGRSMNIHELDAASNNSVDEMRELCKQVQIPPQTGRYKVFIIDEVHMLSTAAFNAFLKTLEEPPSYVIFILATTEKHKILPTILSRCQVYDFQRMTMEGTVEHLKYVAEKEGYTTEPEALNLIAEKADGGMRDALSIFDQMVSFTGGQLTYERVCQSLNVLNTEYYFRMTEHLLKAEVEPCLLLLNEILQKGFDGGNFIGGLASHMRNLLVSRDAVTLPLLEMSDQMRARYQEQAIRCKPSVLYKAIKLCNDCDQSYRTSRNKRLQVEICLIQLAQLAEDDTPSSGLGPTKKLNPIFQKPADAQNSSQPSSAAHNAAATETAPQASAAQPTSPTPTLAPSTDRKPILKKVTLRRFASGKTTGDEDKDDTSQEEMQQVTPLEDFAVRKAWHEYASKLPQEQRLIAQRLQAMMPALTGTSSLEIKVNNSIVAQEIEALHADLEHFLRRELKNCELTLTISLAEAETIQRAYSKTEQLRLMEEDNPIVRALIEELGLRLD